MNLVPWSAAHEEAFAAVHHDVAVDIAARVMNDAPDYPLIVEVDAGAYWLKSTADFIRASHIRAPLALLTRAQKLASGDALIVAWTERDVAAHEIDMLATAREMCELLKIQIPPRRGKRGATRTEARAAG